MPVPPDSGAEMDAESDSALRIVLWEALGRLSKRQRAVLVLRYFEDLPEAEVAALLRCPVGTVRSTAHRSLAKLRALVPELAPEGHAEQAGALSYVAKGIQG